MGSVEITRKNIRIKDLPATFEQDLDEIGFEMSDFDYEDPNIFIENIFTFSDGRVFKGYYGWVRYQEGIVYDNNGKPAYRYKQNGIEMLSGKDDETVTILNKSFKEFCENDVTKIEF